MAFDELTPYSQRAPIKGLDVSLPEDAMNSLNYPEGSNVDTTDGQLVKAKGYEQLLTGFPSATPIMEGIEYADSTGALHLVFGTTTKFVEYNSNNTWTDRSGALSQTGTADYPVFMVAVTGLSQDRLVITNGKDSMKTWTGSGSWSALTTTGFTTLLGGCAVGYKGFLVIGDTTENGTNRPYRFRWCVSGDPTNWSGVTAGFLNLVEDAEKSRIMTMLALRQALVIYKYGSIYNISYKGGVGNVYFSANPVITNAGTISRKGVCPIGDLDLHLVVTEDNIHIFDGFDFQRVSGNKWLGDRIKTFFFNDLNWSKRGLVHCKAFPEHYKVVILYPQNGSSVCNRALIWDWKEDAWHPRTYNDSGYSLIPIGQFFSARKALYGINGNVMNLFSGNSDNNVAINGYFRTKLHDFSDLNPVLTTRKKTTERVELEASGTNPQVEIQATNNITTGPSFTASSNVTDDPTGIKRNTDETIRASGRYHSLKVSDNSTNPQFKIAKYQIFFREKSVR